MSRFHSWIVWFWVLATSAQAQAFQLSGTFSGTADAFAIRIPHEQPPSVSEFDGAPVSGSFDINISNPQLQVNLEDITAYFYSGEGSTFAMSFNVNGHIFNYAAQPDLPSVLILSTGQSLSLISSPISDASASITLSGPPGSLFSGLDPATLHVDPAQSYGFSASFSDLPSRLGANINVTEFHLNSAAPVPEPATTTLLLLGGALLVAAARKRGTSRPTSYAI